MDRIQSEGQKIKIITPRSIDKARLTTSAICDAIIQDCSAEKPKRTLEAKSRQVEKILTNSSRAGYNHVLMIEEAHDLNIWTLKYLKRFWELEDGFKKLLAIVYAGKAAVVAHINAVLVLHVRGAVQHIQHALCAIQGIIRVGRLGNTICVVTKSSRTRAARQSLKSSASRQGVA